MKIFKYLTLLVAVFSTSGLEAQTSEPDFAYPKTVSTNAEADLKSAIKDSNGPATLNALIRYSLAQTMIDPDRENDVKAFMEKTRSEVKSPVTRAMITLLQADMTGNDSLAFSVWKSGERVLAKVPVGEWKSVITADSRFFPSLYDFAAVKAARGGYADSVTRAMDSFYSGKILPQLYWRLSRAFDYQALMEQYDRMADEPESAFVLRRLENRAFTFNQKARVYELCQQWLERWTSSPYRPDVESVCKSLTRKAMSANGGSVVARGDKYKVKVHAECLNDCWLNVVDGAGKVDAVKLHFDGTGVFQVDTVVELTFNKYGVYKIIPRFNGAPSKRESGRIEVAVTDMLLWQQRYGKEQKLYALNAINGKPLTDVTFHTDRNKITASRGADRYTPVLYSGYYGGDDSATDMLRANILTDRGIYHPGDSLRFVAVIVKSGYPASKPVAGEKVSLYLRDVNWQKVDSLTLVSDSFGRIDGAFLLPKEGLTGYYHVEIPSIGSTNVSAMVTDYKAPTFEVKTSCERLSATEIKVTGSAVGYNGFPIIGADVAVEVRELPRWVWRFNYLNVGGATVAKDTVTTAADGTFEAVMTIPADKNLSVRTTASAPNGETHEASAFVPGRPYFISADINEFYVPGKAPEIKALNAAGERSDIALRVVMTNLADSAKVIPEGNWENVPSGAYRLEVCAADTSLAATFEREIIYVYRPTDVMPPAEMALFVPRRSVESGDKLLVGTSYTDSSILMTLWTGDKILSQEWLTPAQGNFTVDAMLPEGVDEATLSFATMRNYQTYEAAVQVTRPKRVTGLNIRFESFRDRMVPGERERWAISVADNQGKPVSGAVILDVYSKALDAIQPLRWDFNSFRLTGTSFFLNSSNRFERYARAYGEQTQIKGLGIPAAHFNLYGKRWNPNFYSVAYDTGGVMIRSSMKMAATARNTFASVDLCEEEAVATEVGNGGEDDSESQAAEESYRLPEVAVALWAPVLTSAPDGTLRVEFEAPDANTTWKLLCQAFDENMLLGNHSAEIVAAKPVMVQTQTPRFLRVGDRTELRATVMNATDSAAEVMATFEVFDPLTADVIISREFPLAIPAGGSVTPSVEVTAPECSMLGVRVRATSGRFSDGEQDVIAVLPSEVTVRSARPLFYPAEVSDISVDVERGGVFELTANAAWECVTALPGLRDSNSKGAFPSVASLFSAAVGRGLVRTYPQIASALERWNREDSVLVSKLAKNADLKIALLESTPWPGAAMSDSERMARLILLLDRKETGKAIDEAIDNLAHLVRKGGLAWTPDSDEPSLWVTERVLGLMARLKTLGYLPESATLNRIINDAVKYMDTSVAKDFAKNKSAVFPEYAAMRPVFSTVAQSGPARRAMEATVQHLVGHWRDLDFDDKALAAIILNNNGYHQTARSIIESLRQYEAWRRTGLNADLLSAFAAVEPQSAEVDLIRQFFIERKQAMDWGEGIPTANLVASILDCGSDWLVPAENELKVKVNGTEINPGAESIMGSMRIDLPEGGKVEVTKGRFPAWGGVFACSVDSAAAVKADGSDKLTLIRRIEGEMTPGARVKVTLEITASQPLDYVVVKSPRCGAMTVVDQLPGRVWTGGATAYREPQPALTNWFFSRLPKGTTIITEEFFMTSTGSFILAPAEVQSQYAPEFEARSGGDTLTVQ